MNLRRDKAGQWRSPTDPVFQPRELRPSQIEAADWMFARGSALNASEPGVGKTAALVEVVNRLPDEARVLIVCPASLRQNWLRELAMWLDRPRRCAIPRRYVPEWASVIVTNYEALARFEVQLRRWEWTLLICDEAHALKGDQSLKTRQLLGDEFTPRLVAHRRIVVTATPLLNRPLELWPLLAIAGQDISRSDFDWRFCNRGDNQSRDPDGLREFLRPIMLRQTKAGLGLPAKIRRVVAVNSGDDRRFSDWEAETAKVGRFAGAVGWSGLTELRIKTALAKLELPQVERHLREPATDKLVVMAVHREIVQRVAKMWPAGQCVTFTGKETPAARAEAVERFQTDPACRVFVGTIGAAGDGLTLTAARRMVILEEPWNAALIAQAEDRVHRIGQTREVLIEHLVIAGSIDAREIELQLEKQRMTEGILDAA
jgi:SWI/SNF-related matrix-associated actin-dependent regulator 1 of chromatin subfamily A